MTGAHHSLILNVIHDPSPYAAVVSAVSPVRSLEPGQTTAHRRHLTAAIRGEIGCRPSRNPIPPCCAGAWALRPRDRIRQTYTPILHAPSITR
jgi:hypothetical protein